jgi:hypothetical protein
LIQDLLIHHRKMGFLKTREGLLAMKRDILRQRVKWPRIPIALEGTGDAGIIGPASTPSPRAFIEFGSILMERLEADTAHFFRLWPFSRVATGSGPSLGHVAGTELLSYHDRDARRVNGQPRRPRHAGPILLRLTGWAAALMTDVG